MTPYAFIVDDFLSHFDQWRTWADGLTYASEVNPIDCVAYPGIYKDVPTYGIAQRLGLLLGPVAIKACFLRLSVAGCPVPHVAHTDSSMGEFSMMLYMNRPEHCLGGTSLLRHHNGMQTTPTTDEDLATWQRDMNRLEPWDVLMCCPMKTNRAFVFPSNLMHRAEPVGGFGTTSANGRLVLTCFFNRLPRT